MASYRCNDERERAVPTRAAKYFSPARRRPASPIAAACVLDECFIAARRYCGIMLK